MGRSEMGRDSVDPPRNAQVVGSSPTSGSKVPGHTVAQGRAAHYPNTTPNIGLNGKPPPTPKCLQPPPWVHAYGQGRVSLGG